MKQPTSVKAISWLNIIASLIGFGIIFYTFWDSFNTVGYVVPEAIFFITIAFIELVLVFLSSIAMLEGKPWGRTLYIIIGCSNILFNFVYFEIDKDTIKSVIKFAIFAFFLYRPIVNEYFKSSKVNELQK
ncbi:hypothetical protein [Rodentibacter myodis]|uniref:Uncharacterized protein n=1 Tax=Rodentibacter myodis TaxID=1907939 RepID=A0A1V3JJS4_9PAST|nr:hypothetical protein [Rodentibacter myodis]OOF56904.1 hypothetical protein BKL49_09810 [Rodentibacter myodis]